MGRPVGSKNAPQAKHLQIVALKKRFNRLNPGVGSDVIDWEATIGRRETYQENLEDLKHEYPEYRFDRKDDPGKMAQKNEKMSQFEARRSLQSSGYAVVKRRDYRLLLQNYKARQAQLRAVDARRKLPPGARRGAELVKVRSHYRRLPRN